MSKANDDARKKLDEILKGLMTDKKMSQSDKRLLATNNRSEDWYKTTAERNRKNATNETINNKIRNTHAGKRYTFLTKESIEKLAKAGWQPIVTPQGIFACKKHADDHYFKNNLTPCKVLGSVSIWIRRTMKQIPDQYYHITKEEYIMLTGKDPWNEK
jgi:hypothetical protein